MALKPAQTEAQLASLAAAADRANKPTSLLTIPVVLLIVTVLFGVWAYRGLAAQRSIVQARQAQAVKVAHFVEQIKGQQKQSIDMAAIYPPSPFLGSYVDDTWEAQARSFRETPTVSQVSSTRVDNNSSIYRSDVTVTVNNEELSTIFKAADATLNHEFLKGRAFVSQANLTPTGTGWRAVLRFSLYEKK